MTGDPEMVETDVLVIGAGGAGMRAAIAAAAAGCRVLVVCKSLLGKAHTVMAEGGMAAALRNVAHRDTWEAHFADTMKGGKLINGSGVRAASCATATGSASWSATHARTAGEQVEDGHLHVDVFGKRAGDAGRGARPRPSSGG